MGKAKKGPKYASPGQPAHKPTDASRALVRSHAIVGTQYEVICDILGLSMPTLRKHYRHELDTSRDTANAAIGGALYTKAMGGDTAAMIFWLKTRARWRETLDITNSDGSLKSRQEDAVLGALAKIHGTHPAS